MAADNRPYKSKEQDGQGNEIIIRDQQLVEQGTATTMASGACFETFDVDNRPVKIPRDNMMSIVLECIGIIVNDSSKNLGTNVQKAIGLQGNLIGNVTVSDLASVLGVDHVSSQMQQSLEIVNAATGGLLIMTCANTGTTIVFRIPTIIPFSYHGLKDDKTDTEDRYAQFTLQRDAANGSVYLRQTTEYTTISIRYILIKHLI